MRVLFVYPQSRIETIGGKKFETTGGVGSIAEPLALEYLAAAALDLEHEVEVLDLRIHPDVLDACLERFQPHVLCVTAFSMHVYSALDICVRARELGGEDLITLVGGHHATLLPEDFFEPYVDHIVTGEGVAPLCGLLAAFEKGERSVALPGVWCRQADGSFELGGPQVDFDINSLPRPDRSTTDRDRGAYFIDWMRPVALLRTTVGCPYRCTFCSLWKIMDGRYHMRTVADVADEAASLQEEFVYLVDDEAFIHEKRMLELAAALKVRGVKKRFFAYCRIDSVVKSRAALEAWREVGLDRIFVGVDGASSKDWDEYNKRTSHAQLDEGLRVARNIGLSIYSQFVVNPNYSASDFKRLVRFIRHRNFEYPTFTVLTPIPGTDLLFRNFENVTERGRRGRPNWELFDCQTPVTRTKLPREQFLELYRGLYAEFRSCYARYRDDDTWGTNVARTPILSL